MTDQAWRGVLPPDFADLIRTMRATSDPRLRATAAAAHAANWTLQSIATPAGVTREAVRIWCLDPAPYRESLPEIPVPVRPVRPVSPPRYPSVDPATADRLRELSATARHVNGATPVDAPERAVSIAFSALLARLLDDGFTYSHLGRVCGFTPGAIVFRLARHGHRPNCPSMMAAGNTYRGTTTREYHLRRRLYKQFVAAARRVPAQVPELLGRLG